MYNKELKLEYINEKSESAVTPNNYLERQFENVSRVECEIDKDIHSFTIYEIIEYYKTLNICSLDVLNVLNSHFSLYTQWCLGKNLVKDNQNHFLEITLDVIKQCLNKAILNKKIVSREQVISWCDQLPNPKDQVIMLGLFEGLKGKNFCDFVNLRPQDVNGNTLTLIDGRVIDVSDDMIRYIKDSIEEKIYYSASRSQVKKMTLVNKGYVIKDYPNTKDGTSGFAKGRIIYNSIARSLNYVGVLNYMSASSIHESGKLWMIKERAKELGITNKEYIYSDYIKEIEYKFNCKILRSMFCKKYEDYL